MYHNFKITVMKKKYFLWSMLTIVMAVTMSMGLSSCGDDGGDSPAPELKTSTTSIKLAATGEEGAQFTITSNTNWTIDVDESWIEVSPMYGKGDDTIEVSAEDNTDDSKRTATITVKAGSLERKVKVTQEAGQSLSVSPQNPQLAAGKGATGSFTITSNSSWTISGTPSWLSLSATQGTNTTTITMTTTEKNFSDNTRTASLAITAGTKSATVTVTQEATFDSSVKVSAVDELILSNGYYTDLNFTNVLGYHEGFYKSQAFDVKTEEDIYNEVLEGTAYPSKEYNYAVISGISANTDYVYCCIPYSGDSKTRKYGKMLIQRFKTKSNSIYCDAATTVSYNSSYWTYTINKQQRCHHYYMMYSTDAAAEDWYAMPPVILAHEIRDWINDKVNHPNYDYFLNDGNYRITRENGSYAFFIWTWGVDDQNEFSGNIRGSYLNLSASAPQQIVINPTDNKSLKPEKKYTRAELNKMRTYLRIERK